jgi:hypothetical protein
MLKGEIKKKTQKLHELTDQTHDLGHETKITIVLKPDLVVDPV